MVLMPLRANVYVAEEVEILGMTIFIYEKKDNPRQRSAEL